MDDSETAFRQFWLCQLPAQADEILDAYSPAFCASAAGAAIIGKAASSSAAADILIDFCMDCDPSFDVDSKYIRLTHGNSNIAKQGIAFAPVSSLTMMFKSGGLWSNMGACQGRSNSIRCFAR